MNNNSVFPHNFLWYGAVLGIFYILAYHSEAKEQLLRSAQLQTGLMQARLQTLRSQLNPHFLFNTLNTISTLSMKGDGESVGVVLEHLSTLLRVALDDSRPAHIPLRSELEFVDCYLKIQDLRFGDKLTITRDIDPETLDAFVPSMILEPIVENAIEHGVYVGTGPLTISINTRRMGTFLRLQVNDSGMGFRGTPPRKRVGLSNTEERLQRLYGSAQRVEYGTAMEGGASVTIVLPFRRDMAPPELVTSLAS